MSNLETTERWPLHFEDAENEFGRFGENNASQLLFQETELFHTFQPTRDPFGIRIKNWLSNFENEVERDIMSSMVLDLYYAGPREFESLYRQAYNAVIAPWVISSKKLNPCSNAIDVELAICLQNVWILPLTDSMQINSFNKVNGQAGMRYRPDLQSLMKFCDTQKIRSYVEEERIQAIVVLEDFVGSGTQSLPILDELLHKLPGIQILMCPMIICPAGAEELRKVAATNRYFDFGTAMELSKASMLSPKQLDGEPPAHISYRKIIDKYAAQFGLENSPDLYGYKATGAQIILHTNCPDNTLSIYHSTKKGWSPLFPRVPRS